METTSKMNMTSKMRTTSAPQTNFTFPTPIFQLNYERSEQNKPSAGARKKFGAQRQFFASESESSTRQVVKVAHNPGSCDEMNSPGNLIFHMSRL